MRVPVRLPYDGSYVYYRLAGADASRFLRELPKRSEVVASCRGPYCVYSVEAAEQGA